MMEREGKMSEKKCIFKVVSEKLKEEEGRMCVKSQTGESNNNNTKL